MNCTRCSFPFDASEILADDETAWHGFCPGCEKEETEERFRNDQAVMREEAAKNPPPKDSLLRKLVMEYAETCSAHGIYSEEAKAVHGRCLEQHSKFETAVVAVTNLAAIKRYEIIHHAEEVMKNAVPWHCSQCDDGDQPHEVLVDNENEGYKTRCLNCNRETWR